jgi:hypothetical protein
VFVESIKTPFQQKPKEGKSWSGLVGRSFAYQAAIQQVDESYYYYYEEEQQNGESYLPVFV